MMPHCDHNEHDVDVVLTEQCPADLRALAPRERVSPITYNCAHPLYRHILRDYYRDALKHGAQTPHNLPQTFA
jgi:succinyl-CoA:acetate CoA-transferase